MRTFLLILLAFLAGVMVLVAALSWQGRAAREYGRGVVRAAQREDRVANVSYEVPCREVLKPEPPATVQGCVVNVKDGGVEATLTLEGGRVFRVSP